jgi:hypothetical protein
VQIGQIRAPEKQMLAGEESLGVAAVGPLGVTLLREVRAQSVRVECYGPLVTEESAVGANANAVAAVIPDALEVDGDCVVEVGSAAGSQDTLTKFRESLKSAPIVQPGVVRVSGSLPNSEKARIEAGPTKSCLAIASSFVLVFRSFSFFFVPNLFQ